MVLTYILEKMGLMVATGLMVLLIAGMNVECGKYANGTDGQRCDCEALEGRIIGGTNASQGEFPFMISIRIRENSEEFDICGAAILAKSWILTAAHCVYREGTGIAYIVRTGEYEIQRSQFEKDYAVEKIILHPNFDDIKLLNDIALLKLKKEIQFDEHAKPISLPAFNEDFTGRMGTVIGWGLTTPKGRSSSSSLVLQKLQVPIMNLSQCRKLYSMAKAEIASGPGDICAGYAEGKRDSCEGDSGGPLFIGRGRKFRIIGVVSRGHGCAQRFLPGVYVNVPYYVKWIKKTMSSYDKKNQNR